MRAAVILGPGCSSKYLTQFQSNNNSPQEQAVSWQFGLPAAANDADVILIFGGDGTVHRHLNQLVELGLPALVVPTGSGNDFARALGLRKVSDSQAAWGRFCDRAGNVQSIDLGVITPLGTDAEGTPANHSHYFCGVAGIGLDGEVARLANQLPRWLRGHGGYALSLPPALFKFAPVIIKIETETNVPGQRATTDWAVRSNQPTLLAAFANTPFYGGGMKIAPGARMDDGQLDVCTVGAMSPFRLFRLFPSVYFGRHLGVREVIYSKARHIRVRTGRPLDVYADGEYVCTTPVELAVANGALRVIIP
jgi:diacylglycerol kinase (ATP)